MSIEGMGIWGLLVRLMDSKGREYGSFFLLVPRPPSGCFRCWMLIAAWLRSQYTGIAYQLKFTQLWPRSFQREGGSHGSESSVSLLRFLYDAIWARFPRWASVLLGLQQLRVPDEGCINAPQFAGTTTRQPKRTSRGGTVHQRSHPARSGAG